MTRRRSGFSLLELLVVIAIIAAVVGILVPTLSRVRTAGRDLSCLTNLRSTAAAWRLYSNDHDGRSPALGVPWTTEPNWALVVHRYAGRQAQTAGEMSTEKSILVCDATSRINRGVAMTRTYAANVTGYAGMPGDRGSFDEEPTFVRFDRVRFPSGTPMILDSAAIPPGPNLPPPTRTASVIDFRDANHIETRIGRVHAPGGGGFQAAMYDGSASRHSEVNERWALPIEP